MPTVAPAPPASRFRSEVKPTWCPGCGDFAVLNGLQTACAALGIAPQDLAVVSGIGCSSNLPGFMKCYGLHSLHGRSLPVAQGVKLGNHALTVVAVGGDGDGYGIGVGHLVHALRRNMDLTYIVMNNQVYGLTTGQASATSARGARTKSTPGGTIENALNPLALALAGGGTFVARGFSGDPAHLARLIERAVAHKGFSLVDVLSPCVTYNKVNTYAWFRQRVYKTEEAGHDPSDFGAAVKLSMDWEERIALGVLYEARGVSTYEEEEPSLKSGGPLARREPGLSREEWGDAMREFL